MNRTNFSEEKLQKMIHDWRIEKAEYDGASKMVDIILKIRRDNEKN